MIIGTVTITSLDPIGNAVAGDTLIPVVNMDGVPTTQKMTVANLMQVGIGANLGPVGDVIITGGTNGQFLQTDGTGNLTWSTASGGGGNGSPGGANTQVQFNDEGDFGGNSGFTFNKTTGVFASPFLAGNGNGLSNIQGANVSGAVGLATYATTANAVAGANVSGFVPNANIANTAFAVAGANVSGAVTFAGTANSVAVANVVGLGNIATVALNGNGSQVLLGNGTWGNATSGASSELVNGGNSFVLDADGSVTFEGSVVGQGVDRGLVWDYGANANGVNSMVRQDNNGITVRAWTENSGGANGYSAPVNIVTNQDATTKTWTFDGSGNLTLPGNLNIPTGNIVSNIVTPTFNSAITSIVSTGNANVIITIASEIFEGPASGQVTISNVNAPAQANGDWYYEAVEIDQFQLYTDANLTTPVDGSSWPGYVDGGTAVGIGAYSNLTVQGGNVSINSDDKTWTFDTNGAITLPSATGPGSSAGNIQTSNAYPTLLAYGSGSHGGPELDWMDSDNPNDGSNANVLRNTLYLNDGGLYVGMNENIVANTFVGSWNFTSNGTTIFPTLEVDLHNGGVQEGQVLQFGNASQQVIITGPTPSANVNAERLIIQGQRGNSTNSEGGDVYVWAGDAELYGGDIKIYAGDADDTADGYGGYVNIDGGQGFTEGGHIALNGGQSANGAGGYVEVYAGQGNSHGGNLTLGAGYGTGGPGGAVTIQGGGSGNGLAEYGNVGISAGASSWTFDNAGNLTLPANTFSVNYANGVQVSIGGGSANTGNVTFDDVTVQGVNGLNLSAGADFTANLAYLQVRAGDVSTHIHLDTGNNEAYDQYFGNDNKFVKLGLGIAGNVSIGTYQDGGVGQLEWTFDSNGNLVLPRGGVVYETNIPFGGLEGNTIALMPSGGTNADQQLLVYPTAGQDFNHLHLTSGNLLNTELFLGNDDFYVKLANTGNVVINTNDSVGSTAQWTFGIDGNLTLPTIVLDEGIDEQTVLRSQRKIIPPFRWSAVIDGATPTIVYTAFNVNTTSMKVTMQIQHAGLGMEFFEVFATFTGADTFYTVGNRVAPLTIDASTVVVDLSGSNEMQITVEINSGATTSWVTYDATEFGIPND